jgi:hypothetical protein
MSLCQHGLEFWYVNAARASEKASPDTVEKAVH